MVIIGLSLLIGVILGYTPSNSLNGFFSFLFIGIWLSYTITVLFRIKKMREYHSSLNNALLIFGDLFISAFYGIWGDFTPILIQRIFPTTSMKINLWTATFSLPYLIFGTFLLLFSITKYFAVYLGNKAINARKFTIFTGIVFLGLDLSYILLRQGIYTLDFLDLSHLYGTFNVYITVHMGIIVFFGIVGIITRNRSMTSYNLDQLTSRMNDIDRRINDAEIASAAAQRSEQRARDAEKERQRRIARAEQRKKDKSLKQQRSSPKVLRPTSTAQSSRKTSASKSRGSSLSAKQLMEMKPKTGTLSKEDFMCIFCFELPTTSDKGRGIVLCPHCRYPAHYDEFMKWVRNSNLCSRCDGVIPASFIRNPTIIPVKTYLKVYKHFKKYF